MSETEVVPIPHHIKATEMAECKECEYYEYIDESTFYCHRRQKGIKVIRR